MEIKRVFMHIPNLDEYKTVSTNSTRGIEVEEGSANAISSLVCEGIHAPVLDIDYKAQLVPSATTDHYHLYLDKAITWRAYRRLLKAMAKAGLIEKGYAKASIRLGYSAVRMPDHKKIKPF